MRKKLIDKLDKYGHKQLLFRPKPNTRSIAKVIEDLYLVEKATKNYIDKKLASFKIDILALPLQFL
jgi:hypothetical protein